VIVLEVKYSLEAVYSYLQTCDSPGGGVLSNGEHDGVQLETVLLDDVRPEQLVLSHLFPVRQAQPLVFLPLRPLFAEQHLVLGIF
jgi:hypothetical protein